MKNFQMYLKTYHINYAFIGNHPSIQQIRELITMVADTAFALPYNNFIKISSSALPITFLEKEVMFLKKEIMFFKKEVFGYEKGVYNYA